MSNPLVTFGVVNCNRLHYLRSCVESLVVCTTDYAEKEIIIVDNASIEDGTEDYLRLCEARGIKVVRQAERDPANEFARGVNTIIREGQGDFIAPLQGDMQFVLQGDWLHRYINVYSQAPSAIGCMLFDAQRRVRNAKAEFSERLTNEPYSFVAERSRFCVSCSADVLYSREILDLIGPFCEDNKQHEGGLDSENEMRERLRARMREGDQSIIQLQTLVPIWSPAVAIYTDPRGTNARIRGNKRYGSYWPAKDPNRFQYYRIHRFDGVLEDVCLRQDTPYGIEDIADPVGWKKCVDANGDWLKNPVRPEQEPEAAKEIG